jgi:hypothetical protein
MSFPDDGWRWKRPASAHARSSCRLLKQVISPVRGSYALARASLQLYAPHFCLLSLLLTTSALGAEASACHFGQEKNLHPTTGTQHSSPFSAVPSHAMRFDLLDGFTRSTDRGDVRYQ